MGIFNYFQSGFYVGGMFANDKTDCYIPYCLSPGTFHKRKKKEKQIGESGQLTMTTNSH